MYFQKIEYAEETFANVRMLTRSLFSLLVARGIVSEQDLAKLFEQEELLEKTNHAKQTPVMELICTKCSRKAVVRLDREVKCMFCGTKLDPEQHRAHSSPDGNGMRENLFSCQIVEEDIRQRSFALGSSKRDDAYEHLINETASHRGMTQNDPMLGIAVSLVTSKLIDNRASGIPIDPKKDYLTRINRKAERLCTAIKILWGLSVQKRGDQGNDLPALLSTINNNKKDGKYLPAAALVLCPDCHKSNVRSNLFMLTCSSCKKEIKLSLAPGLSVYDPLPDTPEGQIVPFLRKKEYLYTLFEAVFDYTAETFGFALSDLSETVMKDYVLYKEKKEDDPRVCAHCGHRIPESSLIASRCMYCGKPNGECAFDRYL